MRIAIWAAVLLAANIMWAKSDQAGDSDQAASNNQAGSVTFRGCVSKSNGDYVLMKESPGITYQLEGGKIRLKSYLGKRVEIMGTESATLSTSEDAINKMGNASPVTITVKSIQAVRGECESR